MGKRPKFIDPILSEHISGDALSGAASRSSSVMPWPPPVVIFTTASVACLIRGRNCMKTLGSGVGRPSLGSRAWRWRIAAPASAAPIAWLATSSGVSGRCGLIVGVWIDPVTAQVMMTFPERAMSSSSVRFFFCQSAIWREEPAAVNSQRASVFTRGRHGDCAAREGRASRQASGLGVGFDEAAYLGIDLGAPALAVEHAVMPDLGLEMMRLLALGQAGAEVERGSGLADGANVVVLALDAEERGLGDGLGLDLPLA